ncbi:hypothetical protein GWK47_048452 [Chionoecetes opilio]|uniref:Ig-like domain-containing protein n=1 Tax=Chionoecetes opilio TaxID=41210 RepID=A0A8J4YCS3_CHIOP|nr:hypothetical protein GWK47_048452 [Chionoecetes opilio]
MITLVLLLAPLTAAALASPHTEVGAARHGGVGASGQTAADDTGASLSSLWSSSGVTEDRSHHDHHHTLPYFHDHQNASSITAQLGSTALLHCRVNRLGDKTLLKVYVAEAGPLRPQDVSRGAEQPFHGSRAGERGVVPLENVQPGIPVAGGEQVGTEGDVHHLPRQTKKYLTSPVVYGFWTQMVQACWFSPVVDIIDARGASVSEKFYKTGSTIELKCTISQMPQAQTFILWRHGDHMLNYDTSRGGISVKTDMSSAVIVSTLFIANASPEDSGNYTCSLGDVATGSVLVHILNGEHPQAMHGSSRKDLCSLTLVALLSSVTTLFNTLR